MTARSDRQLAAIERRLERASLPPAPSDLRRRVLAAIDTVVHETRPPMCSGWPAESRLSSANMPVGAFVVAAVAAAIAVVALSGAAVPTPAMPLSLDQRARLAGVSDDTLAMPAAGGRTTHVVLRQSPTADPSAHPVVLRAHDTHRILRETL